MPVDAPKPLVSRDREASSELPEAPLGAREERKDNVPPPHFANKPEVPPAALKEPQEDVPAEKSGQVPGSIAAEAVDLTDRLTGQRQYIALLWGIVIIAAVFLLREARPVLLPMMAAFLLTLILRPVVRRLNRYRISDVAGAGLTLSVLLIFMAFCFMNLLRPTREWIAAAPQVMQQVREKSRAIQEQYGRLMETANDVSMSQIFDDPDERAVPVEVQRSQWESYVAVLSNTGGLAGGVFVVMWLTFFFLAFGNGLINNILHLTTRWSDKKRLVELVHGLEKGISAYLLTITLINIGLGVCVTLAMWSLGVPNPPVWGVMATLLNFVPYLGALVGVVVVAVVSLVSFETLTYAIIPPLAYALLTSLEGFLVTPAVLGRSMKFNPILVFLSLMFWGWLWGVGGALMAVPLLAVAQLALSEFERTRPISTLLQG